jgi:CRP/FNR family transcriptional regulator, cyclic AMP receptor protein
MLRSMHEDHTFSEIFIQFLLARNMRIHSGLVDQFFISGERHLAKILLLMAEFGEGDESEGLIPEISEESLAKMIGTSQSSVSFFMSRFHGLGLIDYDGRIRVHKALLDVILRDQLPGEYAAKPAIIDIPRRPPKSAKLTHSRVRYAL